MLCEAKVQASKGPYTLAVGLVGAFLTVCNSFGNGTHLSCSLPGGSVVMTAMCSSGQSDCRSLSFPSLCCRGRILACSALSLLCFYFPRWGLLARRCGQQSYWGWVEHKTRQCLWASTLVLIVIGTTSHLCPLQTPCKLGPSCHQLASDVKNTEEMLHLLSGCIWLDTTGEDLEYCSGHCNRMSLPWWLFSMVSRKHIQCLALSFLREINRTKEQFGIQKEI